MTFARNSKELLLIGMNGGDDGIRYIGHILDRLNILENTIVQLNQTIISKNNEISDKNNQILLLKSKENESTTYRSIVIGKENSGKTVSEIQILNVVAGEEMDKKKREMKIIVFGVPLSKHTNETEKVEEDTTKVIDIIAATEPEQDLNAGILTPQMSDLSPEMLMNKFAIKHIHRFFQKQGSKQIPAIKVEYYNQSKEAYR